MAKKMKRPSRLAYLTLGNAVSLLARMRGQKIVKHYKELPKPPFIFVSNHTSFFDFAYIQRAVGRTRTNAVMASKYRMYSSLTFMFDRLRLIGKALFEQDYVCMKQMVEIVKQDGVLAMCPEGQIPFSGETLPLARGLGSFVKKFNLPVVTIRTVGGYFADPPWAVGGKRKGPIRTDLKILLERDQIDAMTADAIDDSIYDAIYTDSCTECESLKYTFKPTKKGHGNTYGLERVLYFCPSCKTEHCIKSVGNSLACSKCGFETEMTNNGKFVEVQGKLSFKNITEWYKIQAEHESDKLKKGFVYFSPVEVWRIRKGKRYFSGSGTFTLNRDEIIYDGTIEGEVTRISLKTELQQYLATDPDANFQIYYKGIYTEFRPKNSIESHQVGLLAQEAYKLKNK